MRIAAVRTRDVRFPTSRDMDGSDAMNPAPDYSAAYVELITDTDDQLTGSGFVFTIGRGNEVEVAAINAVGGCHGRLENRMIKVQIMRARALDLFLGCSRVMDSCSV